MLEVVAVLVVVLLVVGLVHAGSRAGEEFRLVVRDGQVVRVEGRVRAATVQQLEDVVRMARVRRAVIRGVREGGQVRIRAQGTGQGVEQRLRNTFQAVR